MSFSDSERRTKPWPSAVRRLRVSESTGRCPRAGAHDGDEVRVGDVTFTWFRDNAEAGLDPAATEVEPLGRAAAPDARSGARPRRSGDPPSRT